MSDEQNTQPDLGTPEGRAEASVRLALNNPSQVPAKFRGEDGTVNVDALLGSYLELERRQSGAPDADNVVHEAPRNEAPPPSPVDPPAPSPEQGTFADALNDAPRVEPNQAWDALRSEIATKGSVSDQTQEQLRQLGVPDEVVTNTVEGLKAKQTADMARAADLVGGREALDATFAWAKQNMPAEQRQRLLADLQGPNGEMVLLGLRERARAAGAFGEPGTLVDTQGGGPAPPANSQIKPFRDAAERQQAMSDPRYRTDPDYRAMVYKRLGMNAGIDPSAYDQGVVT